MFNFQIPYWRKEGGLIIRRLTPIIGGFGFNFLVGRWSWIGRLITFLGKGSFNGGNPPIGEKSISLGGKVIG